MKDNIKNNETQERQAYVPASVKVLEVTSQKVLCQSGGEYNDPFGTPETL